MYTEIKEICNFLVRYLRCRIPCESLKEYIEHLANLLAVHLKPTWKKLDESGKPHIDVLYWNGNGETSDVFKKAAELSGMNINFIKLLLPDKLLFAISSGLISLMYREEIQLYTLWEGNPDEDLVYDSWPICIRALMEPPRVTFSMTSGELLPGKPLTKEEFKEFPAYLTDPMMLTFHFIFHLIQKPKNSAKLEYLKNYDDKIFQVEIYTASLRKLDSNLMPLSQFHNTKFGVTSFFNLRLFNIGNDENDDNDNDDDYIGPVMEEPIDQLQILLNPMQEHNFAN